MNIFDKFKNKSTRSTAEQATDIYRPKPSWADITEDEWREATDGLPKGKVRAKYFCSKDLPF